MLHRFIISATQPGHLPRYAFAAVAWLLTVLLATALLMTAAVNAEADATDNASQPLPSPPLAAPSYLAIIIDDLGYSLPLGQQALALSEHITFAILPFAPNSQRLAQQANQTGRELMLHTPMSTDVPRPLDKGALTIDMNRATLEATVRGSLTAMPSVKGLNNHMGSLLTQQAHHMQWLISELKKRQLYFIDSRTSPNSLAWQTAQYLQVPSLKRDIFLDNQRQPERIRAQLHKAIALSQKQGYSLAIGHPYPETIEVLTAELPMLASKGIQLITISALLAEQGLTYPKKPSPSGTSQPYLAPYSDPFSALRIQP